MKVDAHLPAAPNNTLVLGWDCSQPAALHAYDRSSFCDLGRPTPKPGHPTATFELAQVVWVAEADAWDCRAVSTTTTHICGLWGYEKAVPSMTDRTILKLTPVLYQYWSVVFLGVMTPILITPKHMHLCINIRIHIQT